MVKSCGDQNGADRFMSSARVLSNKSLLIERLVAFLSVPLHRRVRSLAPPSGGWVHGFRLCAFQALKPMAVAGFPYDGAPANVEARLLCATCVLTRVPKGLQVVVM